MPDGVVLKACGSRRASRCPSCAAVFRADARHLVRAGMIGGQGVYSQRPGSWEATALTSLVYPVDLLPEPPPP